MKTPHSSPFPDFLNIADQLSADQVQLMQRTRQIVQEHLEPDIADHFEAGTFPIEAVKVLGQNNLIGSNLKGYGLCGYDEIAYGLIMRELERCDSAFRSLVSVQGSLVMYPIFKYGSELQKTTWLEKLGKGDAIGAFALTEPQGGSDPSSMETTAIDKGSYWEISGRKRWVTNGAISDVFIVWARRDEGVRAFLCPSKTEGVQFNNLTRKLSLRASVSSEVVLSKVHLPKDAILPGVKGIGSALNCLNQARYGIIWGVLGAAEACFDEVLTYISDRTLFKKPLSSFQLVQGNLADMCLAISNGQLLAMRLGQLKNEGKILPGQISLGKQGNVKMALEVARTCRSMLGANGILLDYKAMRHASNLETVLTYEGTHDIHRLIVGQQITGISSFG